MKKLNCPNCNNIFDVEDPSVELVECPECKMKFPPYEGASALERTFKMNQRKGFSYYTKLKFVESNECYETCLKIHPDDFDILSRYILNLCYLNTFKEDNFDKIIPIFEEHEISLDSQNTYLFLAFVKDFVQNVSVYFNEINKRVIVDGSFINEIYVKPYFKAIKSLKEVFAYLDNIFSLLKESEKNNYLEDNPEFFEKYEKYKNKVNLALNSSYNLINKGDFNYENNEIVFLNTNIKEGEEILRKDDRIIVPDEKFAKAMKKLYITSGSLIGVALIVFIVGLILKNAITMWCSIAPALVAVIYFMIVMRKYRD